MRKSNMLYDIVALINYGVITEEDLDGFSDDLKERVDFFEVNTKMAKKLTEKALMKKLNTMDKEELVTIISDLFKTNKTAEARLNLLFLGEEYGNALLEKYKKQLYKIFNPSNIVRTGFSLEKAQQILSNLSEASSELFNN